MSKMSNWLLFSALIVLSVLAWSSLHVQAASPSPFGVTPTWTPTLTATPTVTVTPQPQATPSVDGPDLVFAKQGEPAWVLPGELVTFTLSVVNRGRQAAVDVVVTDEVPAYLEVLEATATQGVTEVQGQQVTARIGVVGPGFEVRIIIRTRVRLDAPAPLEMENVALLTSSNGGERTAGPVIIRIPQMVLPKTGGATWVWSYVALGSTVVLLGLGVWQQRRYRWMQAHAHIDK